MSFKEDVLSSISFFSIIPLKGEHYSKNAINFMFLPYILSGIISALLSYYLSFYLPEFIVATLALGIIILFHGAQNADALMDFGDGVMKRGTGEERLKVMKDTNTGTGAVVMLFFTYLLTIGALFYDAKAYGVLSIVYGQLVLTLFMSTMLYRNTTLGEGFASYFKKNTDSITFIILNWILPLGITITVFPQFLFVTSLCIIAAGFLRLYVKHVFRGVNGDITGASGEIGRMLSLLLIMVPVLIINIHLFTR